MEKVIIEKNDIVEYQGAEHSVTKVWNHGYHIWYDLKALKPLHPDLPYFEEPLSCPEGEVKFLKKAS